MAQRMLVEMVDDIDGGEAAETVSFGLDGVEYEIDLSDNNAAALRSELERFVEAGRRTGGRKVRGSSGQFAANRSGSSTSAQSREFNQAARAWAAANGYELAERGRISAEVIAGYEAHLASPAEPEATEPEPEAKPVRRRTPRKKKADATA